MSAERPSPERADERRYELSEALRAAREGGRAVDVAALALSFSLSEGDVRAMIEALALLEGEGDATDPLPPPELPADYELLGELGRGGMGVVYRVRQLSLGREVALKLLRPGELAFAGALQRFRREAQALARLRHPHIVSVHEVGECGGHLYYTMDLVPGRSLSELARSGELTPGRSVRLLRQVASAIHYSHSRGIVHRDLKPANVLVDEEDQAYVCDFGLARDLAVGAELTQAGHVLGTPAYMAPEQARGELERIGERTDVYALGAMLYECLTARAPFGGRSLAETVVAVLHEEPVPPRKLVPGLPSALERIALQALEKDPERRYPTARAFLEDLERFEAGMPVLAARPGALRRAGLLLRRERSAVLASALTLLGAALAFWQLLLPGLRPDPRAAERRAAELEARGESAAALALLEELPASGDEPALARLARRSGLRLDVANQALRAGELERARELARAVEHELALALEQAEAEHRSLQQGLRPRLRLPLLQARAFLGLPGLRLGLQKLVQESHWLEEPATLAWRPGDPPLEYGSGIDPNVFLAELALAAESSLLDRRDLRHAAARELWEYALSGLSRAPLLDRIGAREADASSLVAALLHLAGGAESGHSFRRHLLLAAKSGWSELLCAQDPEALVRAALELALEHPGPESRADALKLAAWALDLPWQLQLDADRIAPDELLAILRELPLEDRERCREVALDLVLERLAPSRASASRRFLPWLARQLGLEEGADLARARARREALRDLPGSPAVRAHCEALDLDPSLPPDPELLLARLRAAQGNQRYSAHALLALTQPPGRPIPTWPSLDPEPPSNLLATWRRRLGLCETEPHRLRLAAVVVDARDGSARLERSTLLPLPVSGELEVELEHALAEPWPWPDPGGPLALGWRPPEPELGLVRYRLRARLAWRDTGPVLAWERAGLADEPRLRRGLSPRSLPPDTAGGPERVSLAAVLVESSFGERGPRAWVLLLSRLEPEGAEPGVPWSLERWQRELQAELREAGEGSGLAPSRASRLELASWLAPPELSESLPPLGAGELRAADLLARLMAGDGAFFQDPATARRFRQELQDAPGREHWWLLLGLRPDAHAALDVEARARLAAIEREARTPLHSRGPGWAEGVRLALALLMPAVGLGLLLFARIRARGRLEQIPPDQLLGAGLMAMALTLGLLGMELGGGAPVAAGKLLTLALAWALGHELTRAFPHPAVRLLQYSLVAAALCFALGLALSAHPILLASASLAGAIGLVALGLLGLALPPRPGGLRRGLQLLVTALLVVCVALPQAREAAGWILATLGHSDPLPGDLRAREAAMGRDFLLLLFWGWWMRILARLPGAPQRARGSSLVTR